MGKLSKVTIENNKWFIVVDKDGYIEEYGIGFCIFQHESQAKVHLEMYEKATGKKGSIIICELKYESFVKRLNKKENDIINKL